MSYCCLFPWSLGLKKKIDCYPKISTPKFFCLTFINPREGERACDAYAHGRNCRFFGIELLKIYLIDRNVEVFKNRKSAKSLHPCASEPFRLSEFLARSCCYPGCVPRQMSLEIFCWYISSQVVRGIASLSSILVLLSY